MMPPRPRLENGDPLRVPYSISSAHLAFLTTEVVINRPAVLENRAHGAGLWVGLDRQVARGIVAEVLRFAIRPGELEKPLLSVVLETESQGRTRKGIPVKGRAPPSP
jgi:hypothetical protein